MTFTILYIIIIAIALIIWAFEVLDKFVVNKHEYSKWDKDVFIVVDSLIFIIIIMSIFILAFF